MKKIALLGISILLLLCGCGKFDINKAKDEFKDKVMSSKGYELKGTMEIYNNEDTFKYQIEVNYKKEDELYKVSMINQNNNHEQIILKTEDSVYVVTPSLNKSFKFESSWPDNSSQSYILSSLVNDVINDQNATLKSEGKNYIITATVNYPHNKSLKYQKLYFNKDMDLEKVEVYDENDAKKIMVTITNIDYKAKYKDDYFELDTLIDENISLDEENKTPKENDNKNNEESSTIDTKEENSECQDDDTACKEQETKKEETNQSTTEQETSELDDILYPLYIPQNTYLKSKDKIVNEGMDRTILTFNGDKSFILVEETANVSKEFEIIPVSGDPLLLTNTVAALSDNSISWSVDNKDYYITSSNLSSNELMTIAQSMGRTTATSK